MSASAKAMLADSVALVIGAIMTLPILLSLDWMLNR
jgi:hypothetical protein